MIYNLILLHFISNNIRYISISKILFVFVSQIMKSSVTFYLNNVSQINKANGLFYAYLSYSVSCFYIPHVAL